MHTNQRLRTARTRAGYRTARQAAEALKVPYGTYSGHESGSRGIKYEDLMKYADFFAVSASWLAFGHEEDAVQSRNFLTVHGTAGTTANGIITFLPMDSIERQIPVITAEMHDDNGAVVGSRDMPSIKYLAPPIEAFVKFVVIKISGDKLVKFWETDSVLYFDRDRREDIANFAYAHCICWCEDGSAFIAKPLVSSIFGRPIIAVSPLILYLTNMGQILWFERLAGSLMRAAQNIQRRPPKNSAKSS